MHNSITYDLQAVSHVVGLCTVKSSFLIFEQMTVSTTPIHSSIVFVTSLKAERQK